MLVSGAIMRSVTSHCDESEMSISQSCRWNIECCLLPKVLNLVIFTFLVTVVCWYTYYLQAAPEIQIISHLPAVVVEEVQPDVTTDAARLAPEEVKVSVIADVC